MMEVLSSPRGKMMRTYSKRSFRNNSCDKLFNKICEADCTDHIFSDNSNPDVLKDITNSLRPVSEDTLTKRCQNNSVRFSEPKMIVKKRKKEQTLKKTRQYIPKISKKPVKSPRLGPKRYVNTISPSFSKKSSKLPLSTLNENSDDENSDHCNSITRTNKCDSIKVSATEKNQNKSLIRSGPDVENLKLPLPPIEIARRDAPIESIRPRQIEFELPEKELELDKDLIDLQSDSEHLKCFNSTAIEGKDSIPRIEMLNLKELSPIEEDTFSANKNRKVRERTPRIKRSLIIPRAPLKKPSSAKKEFNETNIDCQTDNRDHYYPSKDLTAQDSNSQPLNFTRSAKLPEKVAVSQLASSFKPGSRPPIYDEVPSYLSSIHPTAGSLQSVDNFTNHSGTTDEKINENNIQSKQTTLSDDATAGNCESMDTVDLFTYPESHGSTMKKPVSSSFKEHKKGFTPAPLCDMIPKEISTILNKSNTNLANPDENLDDNDVENHTDHSIRDNKLSLSTKKDKSLRKSIYTESGQCSVLVKKPKVVSVKKSKAKRVLSSTPRKDGDNCREKPFSVNISSLTVPDLSYLVPRNSLEVNSEEICVHTQNLEVDPQKKEHVQNICNCPEKSSIPKCFIHTVDLINDVAFTKRHTGHSKRKLLKTKDLSNVPKDVLLEDR